MFCVEINQLSKLLPVQVFFYNKFIMMFFFNYDKTQMATKIK